MRNHKNGLGRLDCIRVNHVPAGTEFFFPDIPCTLPDGRRSSQPRVFRRVQGDLYREITPTEYERTRMRNPAPRRTVIPWRPSPAPRSRQSGHSRSPSCSHNGGGGDRDDGNGEDPDGGPPPPSPDCARLAP
jgi:hypothetical protein